MSRYTSAERLKSRWYDVAQQRLDEGHFAPVVNTMDAILSRDPDNVQALKFLGFAELNCQAYAKAELTLKHALRLAPHHPELCINLGCVYQRQGLFEKALTWYDEWCDDTGYTSEEIEFQRGLAFLALGLENEAIQSWEAAVAIEPDYLEAHINLGQLYLAQEDYIEADKHAVAAFELAPEVPQVLNICGLVQLYAHDDASQSCQYFKQAIAIEASFWPAQFHLAHAYRKMGILSSAVTYYTRVLSQHPDLKQAWHYLGEMFHQQGRINWALQCFCIAQPNGANES